MIEEMMAAFTHGKPNPCFPRFVDVAVRVDEQNLERLEKRLFRISPYGERHLF